MHPDLNGHVDTAWEWGQCEISFEWYPKLEDAYAEALKVGVQSSHGQVFN